MDRKLLTFVVWQSLVLSYFENRSDIDDELVIPVIVLVLAKFYNGKQPILTWITLFFISIAIARYRIPGMLFSYLDL